MNEIRTNILSLCKLGRLQQALQIISGFNLNLHLNNTPSSLYTPILQLCIDKKAEKEGRLIHNHLLLTNGHPSQRDLYLNTKLVIFYGKIGDVKAARNVFDEMPERSVVSWTAMISGYCQNGFWKRGLEVFVEMRRVGVGVMANQFTYGSVLKACTSMMCLERGMQVQGCVVKTRFLENLFVQSALVDLHSKCGRMEDARYLFDQMVERDVVCWNAVIGGYAVQGFADDSFGMFRLMLNEGFCITCFELLLTFVSSQLPSSSLVPSSWRCTSILK